MQIIPVTNTFNQAFSTSLDGQEMRFHIWYQDIGTGWFCDLSFSDGTYIVKGARLKTRSPLTLTSPSEFEGQIIPISLRDTYLDIGREPWGNTHLLAYFTDVELE